MTEQDLSLRLNQDGIKAILKGMRDVPPTTEITPSGRGFKFSPELSPTNTSHFWEIVMGIDKPRKANGTNP